MGIRRKTPHLSASSSGPFFSRLIPNISKDFRKKLLLRCVAIFLVGAVGVQEAAGAAVLSESSERGPASVGAHGKWVERYVAGPEWVINLRDAHQKIGAQRALSGVLEHLAARYDLSSIFLEGSSGVVDPSVAAAFPDPKARKAAGEFWLRQGRLSAAEFFALLSDRPTRLYGAESGFLYRRHVKSFEKVIETRPAARKEMLRLKQAADTLAAKVLTAPARQLLELRMGAVDPAADPQDYWSRLEALAVQAELPFASSRQLSRWQGLKRMEAGIDFTSAGRERQALVRDLLRRLPPGQSGAWLRSGLRALRSPDRSADFCDRLIREARRQGFARDRYRDLERYSRYLKSFGGLNVQSLLEEARGFEARLADAFVPAQDRDAWKALQDLRTASRLMELSLSSEDYRRMRADQDLRSWDRVARRLDTEFLKAGVARPRLDQRTLAAQVSRSLAFYRLAVRRDHTLVRNTVRRMRADGVRVAALVTGGFHSDGIARWLRDQRISHLIVLPKYEDASERPYVTVLTRKPRELEEALKSTDLFLSAEALFSGASLTREGVERTLATLVAAARLSGDGRLTPEMKRRYLDRYRERVRRNGRHAVPYRTLERILDTAGSAVVEGPRRVRVTIGDSRYLVPLSPDGRSIAGEPYLDERPSAPATDRVAVPGAAREPRVRREPAAVVRTGRAESAGPGGTYQPSLKPSPRLRLTLSEGSSASLDIEGFEGSSGARLSPAAVRRALPELLAGTGLVLVGGWAALLFLVPTAAAVRAGWVLAHLTHGLGHVAMKRWTDRTTRENKTRWSEAFEGVSAASWARALITFGDWRLRTSGGDSPSLSAGLQTPLAVRLKAAAGPAAGAAAGVVFYLGAEIAASAVSAVFGPGTGELVFWIGSLWAGMNFYLSLTSWTDVAAFLSGKAARFYCGNFGFIGRWNEKSGKTLIPEWLRNVAFSLGMETEIRGEQAGGGSVTAVDKKGEPALLGVKLVNTKRGNLTRALADRMFRMIRKAWSSGFRSVGGLVVAIYHYRYGTSSAPSEIETHWHQWLSRRKVQGWALVGGKLRKLRIAVQNRITHNGDFDEWKIFGKLLSNAEVGAWLARVLGVAHPAKGDSPKAAGMIDLLLTQGMPAETIRAAYQLTVARSMHDPLPSDADSRAWAEALELAVQKYASELWNSSSKGLGDADAGAQKKAAAELALALSRQSGSSRWTAEVREAFAAQAVEMFLRADLEYAHRLFLSRAVGSFGFVSVSTTDPGAIVVSAKGQPISLGHIKGRLVLYASEPAAVNRVLREADSGMRLDLRAPEGETARLEFDSVRVYSMKTQQEIPASQLGKRWFSIKNNPYFNVEGEKPSDDPVRSDQRETPAILKKLHQEFADGSNSWNARSADRLLGHLASSAERRMAWEKRKRQLAEEEFGDPELADEISRPADLLLVGMENNVWLLENQAIAYRTLFPGLKVTVISANKVIEDPASVAFNRHTVVMAVSHSGQTYPTLQATVLFEELRRQGHVKDLMIVTGEWDSQMGLAIGQEYMPDAEFSERIFCTLAGRRTSEPATLTTDTTHAALTEILLRVSRGMHRRFGSDSAFGKQFSEAELAELGRLSKDSFQTAIPSILGADDQGAETDAFIHRDLIEGGKKLGQHAKEPALSFILSWLYVNLTVNLRILPVTWLLTAAVWFFAPDAVRENGWPFVAAGVLGRLIDAQIYSFFGWLSSLALRLVQSRTLLARTGKRTVVIGDVPYVHQILEQYASKLYSLAPGHLSLDVHGANPGDHFLHRFGHRVVRGTLVWLGLVDGRQSRTGQIRENAGVMSGKQTLGVANWGVSAEVTAVSHNPAILEKNFDGTQVLWTKPVSEGLPAGSAERVAQLREVLFDSFERLAAGQVYFWASAKEASNFWWVRVWEYWKSQSRTKIATTSAPVSLFNLGALIQRARIAIFGESPETFENTVNPDDAVVKVRGGAVEIRLLARATGPIEIRLENDGGRLRSADGRFTGSIETVSGAPHLKVRDLNGEVGDFYLTRADAGGALWSGIETVAAGARMARDRAAGGSLLRTVSGWLALQAAAAAAAFYASSAQEWNELFLRSAGRAYERFGASAPLWLESTAAAAGAVWLFRFLRNVRSGRVQVSARRVTIRTTPPSDEGSAPPPGARLAVTRPDTGRYRPSYLPYAAARGARPLLRVGVVDETREAAVARIRGLRGQMSRESWTRLRFVIRTGPISDAAASLRSAGVSVIWESGPASDAARELVRNLGQDSDSTLALLEPLIRRILTADASPLTPEEISRWTLLAEAALPEPAPASMTAGAGGPDLTSLTVDALDRALADLVTEASAGSPRFRPSAADRLRGISRILTSLVPTGESPEASSTLARLSSASHRARYALSDPGSALASPADPASATDTPKHVVTDLDVFVKDGGGFAFLARFERWERQRPGAYRHTLLVRDPSIRTREALERAHPLTARFPGEVLFVSGPASAASLRETLGAREALFLVPGEGAVRSEAPSAQAGEGRSVVLGLDPDADSTILLFETGVRLLESGGSELPSTVRRLSDGSFLFRLPYPAPSTYLEENARVLAELSVAA